MQAERLWQRELALPQSFRLHINVSPIEFRRSAIVVLVEETLRRLEVRPASVVLEITENGLMEDEAEITQALHDLRAAGVGLAIDDFGTGYSSISYLRRLPVDSVKIDRALITGVETDPRQRRLAQAVVRLIGSVELTCIAEGVETAGEAAELQAMGCDYAQGYYFSRPVAAQEMTDLLLGQDARLEPAAAPDTL
ncbi:MAG: EAL domain-containing protein [Ornithinimicrobium sp.]